MAQLGKNITVSYKAETPFNTPATGGSGATRFRPNPSPGLAMKRALVNSGEFRSDLKTTMARLGSKTVDGSYVADLSYVTFDSLIEAALRGSFGAATNITQATAGLTSVTTTANTIVASAGSWLTAGFRVGDVIRPNITGGPAGNNNRHLRVTGVSALVLTVADVLTVDATPRTTFGIVITRKLTQPVTPIRRSFTFEEYQADIDQSELYTGVRVSSMKITGRPDGMCTIEFGLVGADGQVLTTAASPYFTPVTPSSSIGLVIADASIRFGGVDVATLTSFDLTYDLSAKGQPVIGSLVTPDVYDNAATITGSISGTRADLSNLTRFTSETILELQVMMSEPTVAPANFISLYLPRIKLTGIDAPIGADGPMIETMPFVAGASDGVTGYDDTMLVVSSF